MLDDIRRLRTPSGDRSRLMTEITGTLALRQLSTEALGNSWGRLTEAERDRFISTLGQVLEKVAYPKAAEFFSGLEVSYAPEQNKGASRIIPTHVKRGAQGEVSIDYVMAQQHGIWRVVDIILDGQSLAQSVTEQIQAVLKRGSYEGLIGQMEARLKQPS
jgi:phospholipid transport system substrate-binding protein